MHLFEFTLRHVPQSEHRPGCISSRVRSNMYLYYRGSGYREGRRPLCRGMYENTNSKKCKNGYPMPKFSPELNRFLYLTGKKEKILP